MSTKLKLISLNIEMDKHLARVLPFLEREQPDVLCLQEVSEFDFPRLQEALKMEGEFAPMLRITAARPGRTLGEGTVGLAFFSRFKAEFFHQQYSGESGVVPNERDDNQGALGILLGGIFSTTGKAWTVATTHFTWTPDGEASDAQRADIKRLFSTLESFPEIAFCGDFNAPRGREMWGKLAERYRDNIPGEYVSSIDPLLHRAEGLEVMVDGLFTTPGYRTFDVKLVEGVSDHKAVVGYLERIDS